MVIGARRFPVTARASRQRSGARFEVALFAVGVITGTILSFEMGLLWPNFTATFGSVFGLGFAIEGFSFFIEAIFIGIYVYGWGRLSPVCTSRVASRLSFRASPARSWSSPSTAG